MKIHRELGPGFKEVIYKDALEIELKAAHITFKREQKFRVYYLQLLLPHSYIADFTIENSVLIEIKANAVMLDAFIAQTINYLKVSKIKIGLLINFGERSLTYKRLIV